MIYKLSRCFLQNFKSVGLSVQEEKRKIDFQDGHHGSHVGFLIGTILAIFDLQVTPLFPTKFQVNWPFGSEEEAKNKFWRWLPSWISDWNDFSYFWTLIVVGFNDMSTLVDHFVSSPREGEKRDRRFNRRDEREEQGRKRNRNEREETEEIKTFPIYFTCYKDSRPCPTVRQYQLDYFWSTSHLDASC